jgi:hypothetical protein
MRRRLVVAEGREAQFSLPAEIENGGERVFGNEAKAEYVGVKGLGQGSVTRQHKSDRRRCSKGRDHGPLHGNGNLHPMPITFSSIAVPAHLFVRSTGVMLKRASQATSH